MPIVVICDGCQGTFRVPENTAGKRGKCPRCGHPLMIPLIPPAADAAVDFHTTPSKPTTLSVPQPIPPPPATAPVVPSRAHFPIQVPPHPQPVAIPAQDPYHDCPFCGEEVKVKAKKCKHCGETLDVALRAAEEAKRAAEEARSEARRPRERDTIRVEQNTYIRRERPSYHRTERDPFNHGAHIILDILTLGLWLPIHMICWACHE